MNSTFIPKQAITIPARLPLREKFSLSPSKDSDQHNGNPTRRSSQSATPKTFSTPNRTGRTAENKRNIRRTLVDLDPIVRNNDNMTRELKRQNDGKDRRNTTSLQFRPSPTLQLPSANKPPSMRQVTTKSAANSLSATPTQPANITSCTPGGRQGM